MKPPTRPVPPHRAAFEQTASGTGPLPPVPGAVAHPLEGGPVARTYRSATSSHTRRVNGRKVAVRGHVRPRPAYHPQPGRAGRNAVRSYKRASRGHWWLAGGILTVAVLEFGLWGVARGVVGFGFVCAVLVALGIRARRVRHARKAARAERQP